MPGRDRLIVALDLPDVAAAFGIYEGLRDTAHIYKLGYWLLFDPALHRLIETLHRDGQQVFFDAKLHDIPATVRAGVRRAASLNVRFITVHGGRTALLAAMEGKGKSDLTVLAITALTSLDADDLAASGFGGTRADYLRQRMSAIAAAGCDGIVAAPSDDLAGLRAAVPDRRLTIVCPGVRPADAASDDHARPLTPAEAVQRGADYIVVGRPIVAASDPRSAAQRILDELGAVTSAAATNL